MELAFASHEVGSSQRKESVLQSCELPYSADRGFLIHCDNHFETSSLGSGQQSSILKARKLCISRRLAIVAREFMA
jgi:hypothetical protein